MINKTEEQIMDEWEGDFSVPLVSIRCLTYNHENYLPEALDSFLNQITVFPFEIILHDDASTDKTTSIVQTYAEKYPHIITPIIENENQYSRNKRRMIDAVDARIRGKYIALCEGDDYWIDNYKLQKQVDYMESHPDCTFCFTNAYERYGDNCSEKMVPFNPARYRLKPGQTDLNAGELALLGFIPTASFLWPVAKVNLPRLNDNVFQGDKYRSVYAASRGYAHYIDECTCVYRRGVPGSIMTLRTKSLDVWCKAQDSYCAMNQELKALTDHRYDTVFDFLTTVRKIDKFTKTNNRQELRNLAQSGETKILLEPNLYRRGIMVSFWLRCNCYPLDVIFRSLRAAFYKSSDALFKLIYSFSPLRKIYLQLRGRH